MANGSEMVIKMTVNWQTLALVAIILAIFGYAYNRLMDYLGELKAGYLSLFVAGGVLVTLIGAGFVIGWVNALMVLGLFAASGTWMIAGEVIRVLQHRKQVISEATSGNERES